MDIKSSVETWHRDTAVCRTSKQSHMFSHYLPSLSVINNICMVPFNYFSHALRHSNEYEYEFCTTSVSYWMEQPGESPEETHNNPQAFPRSSH